MKPLFKEEKTEKARGKFWKIFILSFLVLIFASEAVLALLLRYLENAAITEDVLTVPLYIMPFVALLFTVGLLHLAKLRQQKVQIIIDSMNKVAGGDYSVRIYEKAKTREFEIMFSNFNKMVEELSSVKTLREDFIREFSHEFKTPLSSVHGFAELLAEGGLSEEDSKKFINIIVDETDRLRRLADNTLIISKLENQQLAGDTEIIKLDEQLNEAIIVLAREWEKKNLSLSSDLQPITVRGNRPLIMQVWVNLISNAIKFTPEGGEITVGLKEVDGRAEVTVKDNGAGIPENELPHIFEKFYRASCAQKTDGNGLGLAICKRILDLHGGEISVKSVRGEGSTFAVMLEIVE